MSERREKTLPCDGNCNRADKLAKVLMRASFFGPLERKKENRPERRHRRGGGGGGGEAHDFGSKFSTTARARTLDSRDHRASNETGELNAKLRVLFVSNHKIPVFF